MKVWVASLVAVVWMWYLYYAYPDQIVRRVPLHFEMDQRPAVATAVASIPPYRVYDVGVELTLPPTHYNHERGTFSVSLELLDAAGQAFDAGKVAWLATYQHWWVQLVQDLVRVVPYGLGFGRPEETFRETLMTGYTHIGGDLPVRSVLKPAEADGALRVYRAYAVFSQHPYTWTQVMLYAALAGGFVLIGLTMLVQTLRGLVQ